VTFIGWIALARLEELAGRIVAARTLIAKGCELCPKSEAHGLSPESCGTVIVLDSIRCNDLCIVTFIESNVL
jgi:hypothetical protein